MIEKQYTYAYKEVIELLKYASLEDVKKIPKNIVEYLLKNQEETYDYRIDTNKTFAQQEKSEITKAIFANFFRDYWATEYQRERIIQKEKNDRIKIEEEKRKRYNPEDIFKRKTQMIIKNENTQNTDIVVYKKKNLIHKILDKILCFLKNKT